MNEGHSNAPVVEGRQCGSCTLCCRVLGVRELRKPPGQQCWHCNEGEGCVIYSERPNQCRQFNCGYLLMKGLSEEWRPSVSKLIPLVDDESRQLRIHVDPQYPDAWKASPYYERLKEWARVSISQRMLVVVRIDSRVVVILPDKDVELGVLEHDEIIMVKEIKGRQSNSIHVTKVKQDQHAAATSRAGSS